MKSDAKKFDDGKPRMDLLSSLAIEATARVLGFGAAKYGPNNWRKGLAWSRVIAALLRHTYAFMRGEDVDEESGFLHVDHMGCCVMFLQELVRTHPSMDDRWRE